MAMLVFTRGQSSPLSHGFLWFSYGFSHFPHGFPMVFLWCSDGVPMVFPSSCPLSRSPRHVRRDQTHRLRSASLQIELHVLSFGEYDSRLDWEMEDKCVYIYNIQTDILQNCVCIYIYMYICIYVYMYICIYVFICIGM